MNESRSAHRADGARPGHRPWRRSRRVVDRQDGWDLRFESAGTTVPAGLVKDSPMLLMAAVEDVCWQAATDGWIARRPHRWHRRAYASWRAQSEWLEQKRLRLTALIDDALAAG